jgi:hypothetical protein
MNIPALGTLRPHQTIPKWLTSNPVAVPYFDGLKMVFILKALKDLDEAEANKAIDAFGGRCLEACSPVRGFHFDTSS